MGPLTCRADARPPWLHHPFGTQAKTGPGVSRANANGGAFALRHGRQRGRAGGEMRKISAAVTLGPIQHSVTALNGLHDRNSVPILLEERAGGFATSEEFLCHV